MFIVEAFSLLTKPKGNQHVPVHKYWRDRIQLTGEIVVAHTYYGPTMGSKESHAKQRSQTNKIHITVILSFVVCIACPRFSFYGQQLPAKSSPALCGRANIQIMEIKKQPTSFVDKD